MAAETVLQVVSLDHEDGTTIWFWTHQSPDEEIQEDRLIGPFDTEQQAKDDALSTLTGSGSVH